MYYVRLAKTVQRSANQPGHEEPIKGPDVWQKKNTDPRCYADVKVITFGRLKVAADSRG